MTMHRNAQTDEVFLNLNFNYNRIIINIYTKPRPWIIIALIS